MKIEKRLFTDFTYPETSDYIDIFKSINDNKLYYKNTKGVLVQFSTSETLANDIANLPVTSIPSTQVFFDTTLPTDSGVVFTPDTPGLTNTLYTSSVTSRSYTYNGSSYQTFEPTIAIQTPFLIKGTTIDAGNNKTSAIERTGAIYVNADSYFNTIRIGKGNNSLASNTVTGFETLNINTSGGQSTAIGYQSLKVNTVGGNNTSVGYRSMYQNNSGSDNSSFGTYALGSTTSAGSNSAFGRSSLVNTTTGGYNSAFGMESLYWGITGANNSGFGYRAGGFLADGTTANTTPQNSVFLGYGTKSLTNNDTNQIVIGYNAIGKGSNTVQLGNTSITNTYLQGAVTVNNAFTLPTTDGTSAQALTTNGSGVVSWNTISLAIPQAQIIYVDSVNGVNATTGRGDINKPYLTPEYALSNITNTATFTGNTATNTTISAISDANNALLEVGMYVSGSGIPFGTIIVAKGNQGGNANTVTLSKATTATATGVTVTWVKTYNVILNGSFVVTSSLFKEGMYINAQSAEISWGAFTLFNIDTYVNKIPYYILGQGNYFGTSISSVFILTNATQSQGYSLSITFGNIETIGTSYVIALTSGSNENYINIVGNYVNARFGRVCFLDGGTSLLSFNSYGLLSGFSFGFIGGKRLLGTHTTPASVSVLSSGYGTNSLANLIGSTTWTGQSSHRGYINGTTHSIAGELVDFDSTGGGGTITASGNSCKISAVSPYTLNVSSGCSCFVYGSGSYNLSAITGALYFYGQTDASSTISGSGTINNYGYIYVVSMGSFTGTFNNYGTVSAGSFGGGGNVNNYGSITMIYYGIGVAANKTFVNRGTIISNGSLLNSNAIITLGANGVFDNYGIISNNSTDVTKGVIEKKTGTLYLRQGSRLKVSNGLSPIIIPTVDSGTTTGTTAFKLIQSGQDFLTTVFVGCKVKNTTDNTFAKVVTVDSNTQLTLDTDIMVSGETFTIYGNPDVYYFGVTTNCDGSTYGAILPFGGTSIAPNDLVGGTLFENINY